MRLDRLLANSGYGSRSAVRALIRSGQVCVNAVQATDPSMRITDPDQVSVQLRGESVRIRKGLYYMMNKPGGVITALEDSRHATIADLIPKNLLQAGLFPVGRLDKDTTGLLLLTNDGPLSHRLTNPRWHVEKEYYFEIEEEALRDEDRERLAKGLVLQSGVRFQSALMQILSAHQGLLTIREGKFHQIKRMLKALGGTVIKLERVRVGPLTLDRSLLPGEIRELTEEEIESLAKYRSVD
jgi:16S rRNA pseudouridine516 synthase